MKSVKKKTKIIKNENYKKSRKKTIVKKNPLTSKPHKAPIKKIQWNYTVNDLVILKHKNVIGLIISDSTYLTHKVESNFFFVLANNCVTRVSGSNIKPFVNRKH